MSSDPFQIEAPPPGAVFYETIIHPDNLAIMEGDERARKLDNASLKKIKKNLREIEKLLTSCQYDEQVEKYNRLKDAHQQAKEAHHNRPDDPRITHIMRRCEREGKRIWAALQPYRPAAAQRHRIRMRLDEHDMAVRNEKLYRQLREDMKSEVIYFVRQIRNRWSALKFRQEIHIKNKMILKKPDFDEIYVSEDEIMLKLKISWITLFGSTQHLLPEGVWVRDLVSPDTLAELSAACERPVTSPHAAPEHGGENKGFENGVWLVIHRIGMNGGLFNYLELSSVLKRYNQANRHRYPIPFGVRRGRKINYCNLDDHPHIFIDGQTFAGKSNAIVQALCTLIQMHSPDELRVVLVDLKQGGDLNPFVNIPHLISFEEGAIIKSPEALETVMEKMVRLMYRRMEIISEITVDVKKYNKKVSEDMRLPRVLIVIDEYGATKMNKTAKAAIDHYATILSTQARASALHLMIGNQQPYSDIVPKEVRGNITFKLIGRQMTMGASMSTMGSGRATRLDKIPGRMICDNGHEQFEVQIAYATENDIEMAVAAARNYPAARNDVWLLDDDTEEVKTVLPLAQVFGQEMLISLALTEFDGTLAGRKMWEHLKANGRDVSLNKVLNTVKAIVSRGTVQHNGITYGMTKPGNRYVLTPVTSQHHENMDTPDGEVARDITYEVEREIYS